MAKSVPASKIRPELDLSNWPIEIVKTLHSEQHIKFTKLIRLMRKQAQLSQVEAAAALKVRQSFISDIERGERRVDLLEFLTICKAYGKNPFEFILDLVNSSSNQVFNE